MTTHYFNPVPYTMVPCAISLVLFVAAFAGVCGFFKMSMHSAAYYGPLIYLFVYISIWVGEMNYENEYRGRYNKKVLNALLFAFMLFLLSEIFLFVGFFWVLLDRYLTNPPSVMHAGNIIAINCVGVPLFGTGMLVLSGYFLNLAYLTKEHTELYEVYNMIAMLFGVIFLGLQFIEYNELFVRISNTVYTSIFYVITGFHGMHVCVGLIMMFLNDNNRLRRVSRRHVTRLAIRVGPRRRKKVARRPLFAGSNTKKKVAHNVLFARPIKRRKKVIVRINPLYKLLRKPQFPWILVNLLERFPNERTLAFRELIRVYRLDENGKIASCELMWVYRMIAKRHLGFFARWLNRVPTYADLSRGSVEVFLKEMRVQWKRFKKWWVFGSKPQKRMADSRYYPHELEKKKKPIPIVLVHKHNVESESV